MICRAAPAAGVAVLGSCVAAAADTDGVSLLGADTNVDSFKSRLSVNMRSSMGRVLRCRRRGNINCWRLNLRRVRQHSLQQRGGAVCAALRR